MTRDSRIDGFLDAFAKAIAAAVLREIQAGRAPACSGTQEGTAPPAFAGEAETVPETNDESVRPE